MNLDEQESEITVDRLLAAYVSNDSSEFARICGCLVGAEDLRKRIGGRLLSMIRSGDAPLAEAAVSILMFSGIAWETNHAETLIRAANEIFTTDCLRTLAMGEQERLLNKRRCHQMSAGLKLLRSLIYVAVRAGGEKGAAFIKFVEAELASTCLRCQIVSWKAPD